MESEDLLSMPEPETSEPAQQPEQEAPEPVQEPEPEVPESAQQSEPEVSEPVQQEAKAPVKAGKKLSRLALAFLMFVIKLMIVALTVFVLFSYIFGVTRNQSLNMQPAVQDGDLLFYYRLVNDYAADDVVIVHYEEKQIVSRIVAVAGDTVDIEAGGLIVNGALVQEAKVIGETTSFVDAVTFPLTVPEGEVFVLGDNRPNATDSRIFGCVRIADIDGRLVGLFRRRNF